MAKYDVTLTITVNAVVESPYEAAALHACKMALEQGTAKMHYKGCKIKNLDTKESFSNNFITKKSSIRKLS